MRFRSILFSFLCVLAISGCKRNKENFTIVGDISNLPASSSIILEEWTLNEIRVIDSTKADAKGKFEISSFGKEPSIYRLNFGDNRYILLSIAQNNIKITADYNKIQDYTIAGSPGSSSLKVLLGNVRKSLVDISTLSQVIAVKKSQGDDSSAYRAEADIKNINFDLTQYIEHYADTTIYLPNAIFAARMVNENVEKEFLSNFHDNLITRFPQSKMAFDYVNQYNVDNGVAQEQKQAPDFQLQTPDGNSISLSSYRGKYVLVDFWASWCGPCRAENPNVVAAYRRFKGDDFEIIGVSLDTKKDNWMAAIAKDQLSWVHGSDLKGWESIPARMYNVNSIPANFLLDPDGNIIAANLRGEELEATLENVLGR